MMANATDITVAIESVVHDAFAEVATRICEAHDIRVKRVSFQWMTTVVGGDSVLMSVSADTDTVVPRRGSERKP